MSRPEPGKELASLDFANLIGGPLNAIVEAQAKAAITTVNFIKQVAFDENKKIVNVEFKYNRKNDKNEDEDFTLTVPFLTMLPVPYITVSNAVIEFNAKITSINTQDSDSTFTQEVDASAGANYYWFASARLQSKTSYQKKSTSSDREERTFDMHVKVEARNQDMPAGTERLLTILENCIAEKKDSPSGGPNKVKAEIKDFDNTAKTITIKDCKILIKKDATLKDDQNYTVTADATSSGSDEWVLQVSCNGTMAPSIGNKIEITNP